MFDGVSATYPDGATIFILYSEEAVYRFETLPEIGDNCLTGMLYLAEVSSLGKYRLSDCWIEGKDRKY